jgi:hypothetical protein
MEVSGCRIFKEELRKTTKTLSGYPVSAPRFEMSASRRFTASANLLGVEVVSVDMFIFLATKRIQIKRGIADYTKCR